MDVLKKTIPGLTVAVAAFLCAGGCCKSILSPMPHELQIDDLELRERYSQYILHKRGDYWMYKLNDFTVEEVFKAVLDALAALQLEPITTRLDKVGAMVNALFADQEYFEAEIENILPGKTRLSIRCGFLNDEERTRLMFGTIMVFLPGGSRDPKNIPVCRFVRPIIPDE